MNRISKSSFLQLKEEDLMFITNPGRMGDEDGSTFIIKKGKELTIYRVDGWMYRRLKEEDISLEDALKQFPKWKKTWKNNGIEKEKGKYKYLYMGFGNGLSIDNSIYKEYEPFLNERIDKYFEKRKEEDRESLQYAAIYDVWEEALKNMANDKGYVLK